MGKMIDKNTLAVRPKALRIVQNAGWSWYCSHHDTYGIGDTEQEVMYMGGAHMAYFEDIGDDCTMTVKLHDDRREEV